MTTVFNSSPATFVPPAINVRPSGSATDAAFARAAGMAPMASHVPIGCGFCAQSKRPDPMAAKSTVITYFSVRLVVVVTNSSIGPKVRGSDRPRRRRPTALAGLGEQEDPRYVQEFRRLPHDGAGLNARAPYEKFARQPRVRKNRGAKDSAIGVTHSRTSTSAHSVVRFRLM